MAAQIERYQDTEGGWRYRVRAANGEIVIPPESVTRPEDVERQITDMASALNQTLETADPAAGAQGEPIWKAREIIDIESPEGV